MNESQFIDWQLLNHAYGGAGDIPALLKQLEDFPAESDWQMEPWFSLWSALYHQGDIYSASIAAVPRIVSILSQSPNRATLGFYLLPVSIAIADQADPIEVTRAVRDNFNASIETLGSIATRALPFIADRNVAKAAHAAVLVSQGNYQGAEDLLEADA